MNIEEVQQIIGAKVPAVNFFGLVVESFEEGHLRIKMPFTRPVENHLGIVYAGAIFSLAEITGGVTLLSVFDISEVALVIRRLEIDFIRSSRRDLFCDVLLLDTLIGETRATLTAQGNADVSLPIEVMDTRGRVIARVRADYYLRSI